ncbi:hypothetical protein F5Y01DRAFT_167539 [Xylaria sp. FL0043]|nr:hypothetical protein F5Y01DRAFT_167539 [Xylaria sp. FL0043]
MVRLKGRRCVAICRAECWVLIWCVCCRFVVAQSIRWCLMNLGGSLQALQLTVAPEGASCLAPPRSEPPHYSHSSRSSHIF